MMRLYLPPSSWHEPNKLMAIYDVSRIAWRPHSGHEDVLAILGNGVYIRL
jgi:hypothetical protein